MEERPSCPRCQSLRVVHNGSIHTGTRTFACRECGRQFVEPLEKKLIPKETWELVDKLLLERISLAGIARVTGISEGYLHNYVNTKYEREVDSFKKEKKVLSLVKRTAVDPHRSRFNAMNYGLLSVPKSRNNGYGLRWIARPERLSECMSAIAMNKERWDCGIQCR